MTLSKPKKYYLIFLIAIIPILFAIGLLLKNISAPTKIKLEVTVKQVNFRLGSDSLSLFGETNFYSLIIKEFGRIKFVPQNISIADPKTYKNAPEKFDPLSVKSEITIKPNEQKYQSTLIFDSIDKRQKKNILGMLDQIWVEKDSEVILSIVFEKQMADINVKIKNKLPNKIILSMSSKNFFYLDADKCKYEGVNLPYNNEHLIFKSSVANDNPIVEIESSPDSFELSLTTQDDECDKIFPKSRISVDRIDFTQQAPQKGNRESTIINDGMITYIDYPKIEKILFKSSEVLRVSDLNNFYIKEISIDKDKKGIKLYLEGTVKLLFIDNKNHVLNCFDAIIYNERLILYCSLIGGLWAVLSVFPVLYEFFSKP